MEANTNMDVDDQVLVSDSILINDKQIIMTADKLSIIKENSIAARKILSQTVKMIWTYMTKKLVIYNLKMMMTVVKVNSIICGLEQFKTNISKVKTKLR